MKKTQKSFVTRILIIIFASVIITTGIYLYKKNIEFNQPIIDTKVDYPITTNSKKQTQGCDGVREGNSYVLKVKNGIPEFTFTFYATTTPAIGRLEAYSLIDCIEVNQGNIFIQKIQEGIEPSLTSNPTSAVGDGDINNDTYKDIRFTFNLGMAPTYGQADWYIYNPKTNKFDFLKEKDGY